MAKLYPPNIAGTLPSFYYSSDTGTTTIVVPFSMNKTVSASAIKGFKLRLKTATTDILYAILDSVENSWNPSELVNPQVSFDIPESVLKKLTVGSFYKIQIAYIGDYDEVGYYSTVAVVKYTAKPRVNISGFKTATVNSSKREYIGEYHNTEDPTEKAYEYKFVLYDEKNNILEQSEWLLHNSYEDVSLTDSIDRYIIRYAFKQNVTYKIQYTVKTNNGLEVSSPMYLVMEAESINPEIDADLKAELNYNNACIDLYLKGRESAITGKFLLTRASSLDNYSSWLEISDFQLIGELPSKFLFRDFTIEQGVTYIYSLQQYNDFDIYSNRLTTEYITAYFEDAFLFDGKKQLRIRFNPKVSSFKTVLQESKKITIGSKYPFIMRNGIVEYKEFPINGLISYYMDNDEFFLSKEEDLQLEGWKFTTDIVDDNLYAERRFKLAVLDWLNNGEIKLFKSPQEGNYIVRLMNINLTPVDQVSRMLHNFSCQATEIADFTSQNLTRYGLINAKEVITYQMRWETIILEDLWMKSKQENKNIYNIDLLNGYKAYQIKITDMRFGQKFSFVDSDRNKHTIMIGVTGAYEVNLDKPVTNLKLVAPKTNGDPTLFENDSYNYGNLPLQGSVTFSIMSASQNRFDSITDLNIKEIPIHQVFGPDSDILFYFNNFRRNVSRIYYARFFPLEVVDVYDPLFGSNIDNNLIFTGRVQQLEQSTQPNITKVYDIPEINEFGEKVHYYYRYYQGKLYAEQHFETSFEKVGELSSYIIYQDEDKYYRLYGKQLQEITQWVNDNKIINNKNIYTITYNDLTPYVIYRKHIEGSTEQMYFKYNGYKLIKLDNYSTLVQYGDNVSFNVAEKETYFTEIDYIPSYISLGSGVCAELGLQVREITYSIEKDEPVKTLKMNYDKALLAYHTATTGLKQIPKNTTNIPNTEIFTYNEEIKEFYVLEDHEINDEWKKFKDTTKNYYLYMPTDSPVNAEELDALYTTLLVQEALFIEEMKRITEERLEVERN